MAADYTTEAARAAGPDRDDSVPEWALDRIAALERLVKGYHDEYGSQLYMSTVAKLRRLELQRNARDLLDLD